MRKYLWGPVLAALFVLTMTRAAPAQNFIWNTGNYVQSNPKLAGTSFVAPNTPAAPHKILGFIPDFIGVTNKRVYSYNAYPTDSQLPGLAYLKQFGYRVAQPAK
jgi:hypothetical protein